MPFDPATFLATAKAVLKAGSSEADHRTIAGRAYYAAYGLMRARLCSAKGTGAPALFGPRGRHKELTDAASRLKPFNGVAPLYNGLRVLRNRADYTYNTVVSRRDAVTAVDDADWVLRQLRGFTQGDYKSFPLNPYRS